MSRGLKSSRGCFKSSPKKKAASSKRARSTASLPAWRQACALFSQAKLALHGKVSMTCPTPSRRQASRPGIPDGQTEFVFKWFSVSDARVYYMEQQS